MMKRCTLTVVLTVMVLAMASCPRPVADDVFWFDQKGPYSLSPLPSLVMHETFDDMPLGLVDISTVGSSSLLSVNGTFITTMDRPASGSTIAIVAERFGRSLQIKHEGMAGGNYATEIRFEPNDDVRLAMEGRQVLVQFRYRLEHSANAFFVAPYIYHTKGGQGGDAGQVVWARANGAGTYGFYRSDNTNSWRMANVGINDWHRIEILLDYTPDADGNMWYRGFVNGEEIHRSIFRGNYFDPDPLFPSVPAGLGMLRWTINTYDTTAYLDDLRITTDAVSHLFDPPLTVTFDTNIAGDTELPLKRHVRAGNAVGSAIWPVSPSRPGHDFIGWFTGATGGEEFHALMPVTTPITLYARWVSYAPGAYGVFFDRNGGDLDAGPPVRRVEAPATTITQLPDPPVREFWQFAGWNSQADGSGTAFNEHTTVNSDMTVYAQWTFGHGATIVAEDNFEGLTAGIIEHLPENQNIERALRTGSRLFTVKSLAEPIGSPPDPGHEDGEIAIENDNGNTVLRIYSGTNNFRNYEIQYLPTGFAHFDSQRKQAFISFRAKWDGGGAPCLPFTYDTNRPPPLGTLVPPVSMTNQFGNSSIHYVLTPNYRFWDGSYRPLPGTNFVHHEWQQIDIVMDFEAKRYVIFWNGTRVLDHPSFRFAASEHLGVVRFYLQGRIDNNPGTMWLDDIKISYGD